MVERTCSVSLLHDSLKIRVEGIDANPGLDGDLAINVQGRCVIDENRTNPVKLQGLGYDGASSSNGQLRIGICQRQVGRLVRDVEEYIGLGIIHCVGQASHTDIHRQITQRIAVEIAASDRKRRCAGVVCRGGNSDVGSTKRDRGQIYCAIVDSDIV